MNERIVLRHRFLFWTWETAYLGSSTVWHEEATGRRASTMVEADLADRYAALRPSLSHVRIELTMGFGPWKRVETFVGSSTVWRNARTGRRASTPVECRLLGLYRRAREETGRGSALGMA